ncbi:MAG: hypothetical protein ACFFDN_19610 [Candidatus Hodarchaeota archaeon]
MKKPSLEYQQINVPLAWAIVVVFILDAGLFYHIFDNKVLLADTISFRKEKNIAQGKDCRFNEPNYSYAKDSNDYLQLTDGKYTRGTFWTKKTTVGWYGYDPISIVIDLGSIYPISSVTFNTVIGEKRNGFPFGPQMPEEILVLVSDDDVEWYFAGEMVEPYEKTKKISKNKNKTHKFIAPEIESFGRYVQLIVIPSFERYVVVDEIEVFQGESEFLKINRGQAIRDTVKFQKEYLFNHLIRKQLRRDLQNLNEQVNKIKVYQGELKSIRDSLNELSVCIDRIKDVKTEGFKAILPMNELEGKIFRLQSEIWRYQKKPILRVWKNNRWDPLLINQEPEGLKDPIININMMNGEYRADVLNLTNAAENTIRVNVEIIGLPGGDNPGFITVYQVITTGTRRQSAVSAALIPLEKNGSIITLQIPSGVTKQLWFSFHPEKIKPGNYKGNIVIDCCSIKYNAPINLRISKIYFPKNKSLFVSGWSYTNIKKSSRPNNAISQGNRMKLIKTLISYGVNAPWATNDVLPIGKFDKFGQMIVEPDTKEFDEWISLWPDADLYFVYLELPGCFKNIKPSTKNFKMKIAGWAKFWKRHMIDEGMKPSNLGLLIKDEPNNNNEFSEIIIWSSAIKSGAPEFIIWENPHASRNETGEKMMEMMDVLCIHRGHWLQKGLWYQCLFKKQKRKGRDLWFYSPDRHPRSLDPYTYYLGQAWHAFQIGAKGSAFWSFADMKRTPVWNEYLSKTTGPFSPLFIDSSEITKSKYMEAIREGAQDYEYLNMLKEMIESLEKEKRYHLHLEKAKNLLSSACSRVLETQQENYYHWNISRDRSKADIVRYEILEQIEILNRLN